MPSKYRLRHHANSIYAGIRNNNLVKQGRPLLLATMLASLAVYGFHFFASRTLGVERYGTVASLFAIATLISIASRVGTTIVARLAAEFEAAGDPGKNRKLFDLLVRSGAIFFVAIVATAFVFRLPFAAFLQIDDPQFVELTAILVGLIVVSGILRGLQQGAERFTPFGISFVIENVGRALFGGIGILSGQGIAGVLYGQIVAGAAAVAYTYFDLQRVPTGPPAALRVDFARLLKTSGGIAIAGFCLAVLSYFDVLLAKHYLSPLDAGLYGFAVLPGRTLSAIVSFLPTLILPKATTRAATGKPGHTILFAGLGLVAAFSLPAIVVFWAFSVPIVTTIAGPAYLGAAPLVLPYGYAMAFFALTSIAVSYKIGRRQFDFIVPLSIVTLAEIAGIVLFHNTASEIIHVVLVANGLAFVASILRILAAAR